MSTTSQKHKNFVAEPMGDKPVTDVAGIGEVLGKRLVNQGFDKVFTYNMTSLHFVEGLEYFSCVRIVNPFSPSSTVQPISHGVGCETIMFFSVFSRSNFTSKN
jgi:hypothetical protein